MEIYAPLADRMGMHRIRDELEDLSFKVLNNNNSMDLMSTISGSDPGSSWFSRSWDGTTRVLTLTAKDAARTYIVAECEVLFYGGIQDD